MLRSPDAREFATAIARDNPKAASEEVEIASRASAALARIAVRLPDDQRRRLASDDDGVEAILQAVLTKVLDRPLKRRGRSAGRTLNGDGLGEPLPMDVAVGRLQAIIKPMKLEEWAGPVYGSTQLERELGIARSTLHAWRAQGAVIGLLAGLKKEVFPVAQFVDCRPVGGLAQVVSIINEPRTSWLWLISPHPELGGVAPLDRLKQGMDLKVIELARSDYGQS
jgi:hypothetical protein